MMLFPDTSALAIFGPHSEDKMVKLAQKLANVNRRRASAIWGHISKRFQVSLFTEVRQHSGKYI
jgi:hypothetical protein